MNDDIAFWHWMYHHDHGVPDNWIVRTTVGFVNRISTDRCADCRARVSQADRVSSPVQHRPLA